MKSRNTLQSFTVAFHQKISRSSALGSFALAAVLFSASAQGATIIYSENFESTGVADNAFVNDWPSTGFIFTTALKGNLLNPTGTGSTWLNPVPSALGAIFATLHTGGIATANTGQTFTNGQTYTFSFTHFRRDDTLGDAVRASIRNSTGDLSVLDFAAVTATDTYTTREVSYTATPADAGQTIFLRFFDSNGGTSTSQAGIDNIQLSVIPEPSAALLGGIGLLALLRRRR